MDGHPVFAKPMWWALSIVSTIHRAVKNVSTFWEPGSQDQKVLQSPLFAAQKLFCFNKNVSVETDYCRNSYFLQSFHVDNIIGAAEMSHVSVEFFE